MLETELKDNSFRVIITISGKECSYSKFLWKKFGTKVKALDFVGYVNQNELYSLYQEADCLIFPSRVETWGLPISEFSNTEKPMLLADLPYAHETSLGCRNVAFFDIKDCTILKEQMKRLMDGDYSFLNDRKQNIIKDPACYSWDDLFKKLI
jgi:Glycosyltransferase